jgi:hypothetical protein
MGFLVFILSQLITIFILMRCNRISDIELRECLTILVFTINHAIFFIWCIAELYFKEYLKLHEKKNK